MSLACEPNRHNRLGGVCKVDDRLGTLVRNRWSFQTVVEVELVMVMVLGIPYYVMLVVA